MGLWEPVNGVFTASASWLPRLDFWDKFEWFPFFMATIGALAGAWFGAWAAQRIAAKNKLREDMQKEIRDTNVAIVLALGVVNSGAMLKRQQVRPLVISYESDCALCQKIMGKAPSERQVGERPKFSLLEIHEIAPPVHRLEDLVHRHLTTIGRALDSATQLSDSVANLNAALRHRNSLIEKFKRDDFPKGAQKEHFYFGLPYDNGQTNTEYGDTISGIGCYTDDVIFFASKLCEDLGGHGESLLRIYRRLKLGGVAPSINQVDLSAAKSAGLIPDDIDYEAWTSGFSKIPAELPTSWWQFWHK